MRIGFEPPDQPEYDPGDTEAASSPSHIGDVGQLTTNDDSSDSDDDGGWTFTHHIYFAVHVGPFMLVIGRPE